MSMFLAHGNVEWAMAGLIVFVGLMVFLVKLARGHVLSTVLSAGVWWFVYSMHRGSNAGIMTASESALLFDLIGIPILLLFFKRR